MRSIVKAAALAVLVCAAELPAAAGADKAQPASDPGEEIKEGVVKFGHGIRDGAVRAWGAVKSAVGGSSNTGEKRQGRSPQKSPPSESK